MRAASGAALAAALLLTGCNQEPSFDERYAATEQKIRRKAAELDKELRAARQTEQPAASGTAGGVAPNAAQAPAGEAAKGQPLDRLP